MMAYKTTLPWDVLLCSPEDILIIKFRRNILTPLLGSKIKLRSKLLYMFDFLMGTADEDSSFLQNFGKLVPDHKASQHSR
jgi:hypothetical protein